MYDKYKKTNTETIQDVYYLVGSVINRQTRYFTSDDILKQTKREMLVNRTSDDELKKIIAQEIDILYRNNFLRVENGQFLYNDDLANVFI